MLNSALRSMRVRSQAMPSVACSTRLGKMVSNKCGAEWCGAIHLTDGRSVGGLARGYESSRAGATVVMLLPARMDTAWFHDYIYGRGEIRFLRGRVKFGNGGKDRNSAPFPSMIVVFRG